MRIIFDKLANDTITVIEEDSNTATGYPAGCGVLEGDKDTVLKVAAIMGLDTTQIPDNNMTIEQIRVYKKRNFCDKLYNLFLTDNEKINIDTSTNVQIAQTLLLFDQFIRAGAVRSIYDMLMQMPASILPEVPDKTSEYRKQEILQLCEEFLTELDGVQ